MSTVRSHAAELVKVLIVLGAMFSPVITAAFLGLLWALLTGQW